MRFQYTNEDSSTENEDSSVEKRRFRYTNEDSSTENEDSSVENRRFWDDQVGDATAVLRAAAAAEGW